MKGLGDLLADITAQTDAFAPPDVFRCAICEDGGWTAVVDAEGVSRWRRCECAERELEAQRRAAMLSWCELPPVMREQTFAVLTPKREIKGRAEAVAWLQAYAEGQQEQPWVWLHGDRGLGKTHLAVAVLNYRLEHPGLPLGKYVHVEDWLDHLRAGFADSSYEERFQMYCEVPLLVLDDIGSHQGTPFAVAKVDQLVDYRYRNKSPTIFTTNPAARLPERTEDRLGDVRLCRKFDLRGASLRRQR